MGKYIELYEDTICRKCAGCNLLENSNFKGVMECNNCTEKEEYLYGSQHGMNN